MTRRALNPKLNEWRVAPLTCNARVIMFQVLRGHPDAPELAPVGQFLVRRAAYRDAEQRARREAEAYCNVLNGG